MNIENTRKNDLEMRNIHDIRRRKLKKILITKTHKIKKTSLDNKVCFHKGNATLQLLQKKVCRLLG